MFKIAPRFHYNNVSPIYHMNNFQELILNRRSIRKYTTEPVSPDDVQKILAAGLVAPTSKNKRAWEFIVVENKETIERLSQFKPNYQTSLDNPAFAVVVSVDSTETDAWIEDASVASSFMMLQATDLGLGSCWVQVRGRFDAGGVPSEEYVQEVLGIPENFSVLCILTFGHKDEERKPINPEKIMWEKVHIGKW